LEIEVLSWDLVIFYVLSSKTSILSAISPPEPPLISFNISSIVSPVNSLATLRLCTLKSLSFIKFWATTV
jgi:hypothetical protein